VIGGSGTGATFNFTKYAVGIRKLTIDGVFIGACSALGAYFDTISELILLRFGVYGAGSGGNVQITSSSNLENTVPLSMVAANIAGNLFLGRVVAGYIQGNFGSIIASTNCNRVVGVGTVGPPVSNSGTGNNFTLMV
jgi:hypothetical protein